MEKSRYFQSMLLDFYGELLTEKQRECYDLHYNEDLSLAEIAEQSGISRQGVWDNIRRAEAALKNYEDKTGLVRKFYDSSKALAALKQKTERLVSLTDGEAKEAAQSVLNDINRLAEEGFNGI